MYQIKTDKFKQERKVKLDDMDITISAVGAGTELAYEQKKRRLEFLEKKMKGGSDDFEQMEKDLNKIEELEDGLLDYFNALFRDGTPDNQHVRKWLNDTPMEVILAAFEEIKRQFEETDKQVGDGQDKTETTEAQA